MIAARSFEFLSLQHHGGKNNSHHHAAEDSAVTDLDYNSEDDDLGSPPDYEEVFGACVNKDERRMDASAATYHQPVDSSGDIIVKDMIFNLHSDTLYSTRKAVPLMGTAAAVAAAAGSGDSSNNVSLAASSSSGSNSLELTRSDPSTQAKILRSTVFCIHRNEGCAWSGQLGKLKAHLNTCQKDAVYCANACGAKIARVNMEDHLMYTCKARVVNCAYCRRAFPGSDIETHQSVCGFEPLPCEAQCGASIARNRLKAHMVNTCPKRKVSCRHCGRGLTADTLSSHHQTGCSKFPVPCPNRCGETALRRDEVDRHLVKCRDGQESCPHAEAGCQWRGHPSVLEQHMLDNKDKHLDLLVRRSRFQQAYIERLKSELESAAAPKDGVLVWKIANFTEQLAEAKSADGAGLELVSRPFYTSSCGYKLQVSLFPGGNGGGEDTHLSVYIKILPGEYDSVLKWPFRHTVSFALLDQNPDRSSAVNIVESFLPDPAWPNFARASKAEEPDQLGFGFPKFVPHRMLELRNYIKDDAIFIKIRADPNKGVAV